MQTIIDCSKVWKEVKLEQIIVIIQKARKHDKYFSGRVENNQIVVNSEIEKEIAKSFGFFINDLSKREIDVGNKIIKAGSFLGEYVDNKRGVILNKFIKDGKYPVIGGKEISRYKIKQIRGYINDDLSDTNAKVKQNSVLVQGIVAHIKNPIDHIKITANISDVKNYFIADNINQLIVKSEVSNYFIWAILNSALINWYCYRFIYGKSIRTMRFDNPATDRIPIPKITKENQTITIKFSKQILKLYEELDILTENSNKWNSIKEEIAKTDRKIDEEVYKLYGLTEEEIEIIENLNK